MDSARQLERKLKAKKSPRVAIGVSILALIVSVVALGWNVYRGLILKPHFRVRLRIAERDPSKDPDRCGS